MQLKKFNAEINHCNPAQPLYKKENKTEKSKSFKPGSEFVMLMKLI